MALVLFAFEAHSVRVQSDDAKLEDSIGRRRPGPIRLVEGVWIDVVYSCASRFRFALLVFTAPAKCIYKQRVEELLMPMVASTLQSSLSNSKLDCHSMRPARFRR